MIEISSVANVLLLIYTCLHTAYILLSFINDIIHFCFCTIIFITKIISTNFVVIYLCIVIYNIVFQHSITSTAKHYKQLIIFICTFGQLLFERHRCRDNWFAMFTYVRYISCSCCSCINTSSSSRFYYFIICVQRLVLCTSLHF